MGSSRWLIFAPVAILALFAPTANAEPIAGLQTTYYTIDTVPPTRSDNIYTECGNEIENNINRSYDGEPYLNCTNDLFMVHMTGFITIPEHQTIEFWLASDDGGNINIGGNEWGNWGDQGCSWMESGQIDINAGSQPLDLWMYENGGGTCIMLAWNIDGQGFEIVPDSAYTTDSSPTTTTTIPPDTTVPITTTTDIPVTTIQETTTWVSSTTSTTTTTTTSTIAPSTTVLVTPNLTTTTLQIISTPQPEPTMPDPPATVPLPQIEAPIEINPPETLNLPPEIVDTMPEPVDTYPTVYPPYTLPFVGQLPDLPNTVPLPLDTLPDVSETLDTLPIAVIAELPPELVQAFLDAGNTSIPLTEEEFTAVVNTIADLTPTEAAALITQILATAVTPDQATELASNPDVLAVLTSSQAEEIFATIEIQQLDDTQIAELTAAIQNAPPAIRKAFEQTIDIFGGFDDYIPTGSNIPVGERRTLIAIAAGTTLTAAGSKMKRK